MGGNGFPRGMNEPAQTLPPLPDRRERVRAALPGAALAFLLGLATVRFGLVQDDHFLITHNPQIRSLASAGEILATPYSRYADLSGLRFDWRPLPILTFAVEHAVVGTRPFLYHFDNALLHAAVTFLAGLLAARIARHAGVAFWTGLVFAVLPVHGDNVAGVTERSSLLAMLCGLGFLLGHGASRPAHRAISALLLFLALLSKESAIAFPAFALLLDLREQGRPAFSPAPLARRYLPSLSAGTLYLGLRVALVGAATYPENAAYFSGTPWTSVWPTMGRFFVVAYLLPSWLGYHRSSDYSFRSFPTSTPDDATGWILLAATAATALGVAVAFLRERRPWQLGILWFLGGLLPVSNLFVRLLLIGAERLLYVPSFGVALVLGCGIHAASRPERAPSIRAAARTVAALYLAWCALQFLAGVSSWRSERDFYDGVLAACPDNVLARAGRARLARDAESLAAARGDAAHAVRVAPEATEIRFTLGWVLLRSGLPEAAAFAARQGLALDASAAHKGYTLLGQCLEAQGRIDPALDAYTQALSIRPRWAPARIAAASVRLRRGEPGPASELIAPALEADADDAWAAALAVRALSASGRHAEAAALAARPPLGIADSAPARFARAALKLDSGSAGSAADLLGPELPGREESPLSRLLRAEILDRLGDAPGAESQRRRARPGGDGLDRLEALPEPERRTAQLLALQEVRALTLELPALKPIAAEIDAILESVGR